ncbi:MAG: hypothetical protein HMLIMOIP_000455 [Candidatus Nitrosomirales archaeon]|jgi:hypothetical protein
MALRVNVDEDLEIKFREAAMRKFGFSKGSLSQAAEEAIRLWLASTSKGKFEGDPVEAIDGILSDIKMDSVKMQHLASKLWSKPR